MTWLLAFGFIVAAYLSGSIPMGYLIARLWGINVLESGSGRTGGTNVLRAAGLFPALLTILGDAFKGIIPTYLAHLMFQPAALDMPWVAAVAGAATVLGHNHSVFLRFRGGAGGVTALGALSSLAFYPALIAAIAAIVGIAGTRYASVGTFSGAVVGLVALIIFSLNAAIPSAYILYGVLVTLLIGWALRGNFARIRAGTERRIGGSEEAGSQTPS